MRHLSGLVVVGVLACSSSQAPRGGSDAGKDSSADVQGERIAPPQDAGCANVYTSPGCGANAPATQCVAQDAECAQLACGCDGIIIQGCNGFQKPYASTFDYSFPGGVGGPCDPTATCGGLTVYEARGCGAQAVPHCVTGGPACANYACSCEGKVIVGCLKTFDEPYAQIYCDFPLGCDPALPAPGSACDPTSDAGWQAPDAGAQDATASQ